MYSTVVKPTDQSQEHFEEEPELLVPSFSVANNP